jgi:T4 gene Gp59 loader of gp41 DNA helicase/T4 gene Gp59 loader of gp41 DNA helicase C-term
MTPYDAYVLYTALKAHFIRDSYDFIKYQGKMKLTIDSFELRKDKFFFAKLAKHKNPKDFIIANFVETGPNTWIGDLINNSTAEKVYTEWNKRRQALSYYFEQDLNMLLTNISDNITIKEQQHPHLLKLFLRKNISIETIIILDDLLGYLDRWDKKLKDDPLWKDISIIFKKYRSFLEYDITKMRKLALKHFEAAYESV